MAIVTLLITVGIVVILIVSGVVVNMYFYSRGAISRHLRALPVADETIMEGALPGRPQASDQAMGSYVRKWLIIFLVAIFALLALLAVFLNGAMQ